MEPTAKREEDANSLLAAGAAMGAVGVAGALVTGAVCPLCVIVTPVLLGFGLIKKLRLRKRLRPSIDDGNLRH